MRDRLENLIIFLFCGISVDLSTVTMIMTRLLPFPSGVYHHPRNCVLVIYDTTEIRADREGSASSLTDRKRRLTELSII